MLEVQKLYFFLIIFNVCENQWSADIPVILPFSKYDNSNCKKPPSLILLHPSHKYSAT